MQMLWAAKKPLTTSPVRETSKSRKMKEPESSYDDVLLNHTQQILARLAVLLLQPRQAPVGGELGVSQCRIHEHARDTDQNRDLFETNGEQEEILSHISDECQCCVCFAPISISGITHEKSKRPSLNGTEARQEGISQLSEYATEAFGSLRRSNMNS